MNEQVLENWVDRVRNRTYKERSQDFADFALRWLTTRAVCEEFGSVDSMHHEIVRGHDQENPILAAIRAFYEAYTIERVKSIEQEFITAAVAAGLNEDDAWSTLRSLETRETIIEDLPNETKTAVKNPWQNASTAFRELWTHMPGRENYD
jgi:hypothetical protein